MTDQNWWEQAPLVEQASGTGDKWWEQAPLAEPESGVPSAPKKSGGVGELLVDAFKRLGGSAISGVASIPEGAQAGVRARVRESTSGDPASILPAGVYMPGIDTDETINGPMTQKERDQRELSSERMVGAVTIPGAAAAAKWGKDKQQAINDTTSQATKDAVANSQITGNLLKGEIDFGKDPSVRGFLMQGADVFGSMLPVVATAIATRSPGAGAAVGGTMAAGEGVGNARDFIAKQSDAELLKHSPLYARMINAGASPEEARKIVSTRAEDTAGVLQGLVASMGDHFTGKLVTGALDPLIAKVAGKTVAGKVAGGAALSALEEGTQELTEGVASDLGTKSVAGNKEIGEDSAANFVLGALGGAAPGAGRGAVAGMKERRATSASTAEDGSPAAPDAPPINAAPAAEGLPAAEPTAQSSAAPAPEAPSGRPLDPSATQRLAELEVIDSTTGLSPEQEAERATLALQIEEQAAREVELEEVGESPEAAATAADPIVQQGQQDQQTAEGPATGGAFDPATVQAKTWPQFVLERGEKVSTLRKGTPMWNQLQAEWNALKTHRAGVNTDGTGAVGAPAMEIQNRDRSRPASVVQMQAMARDPDYMRLGPSRTPESGAPMVFANGDQVQAAHALGRGDVAVMSDGQRVPFQYAVMEAADVQPSNFADGGVNPMFDSEHPGVVKALNNGRTAGLRAAYERGTAEAYKQELLADSAQHGIDPAVIQGMQAPVLVRLYSQDHNRTNMGAKSQSQALGLSATEQAATDAVLVDNSVLETFDTGALDSAANRDFARAFIGKLQQQGQDVAGMLDAGGGLSPAGVTRLQAALVHKAYGDGDLVESMFGSTDNDIRAIGEALKSVAGEWANMRAAAESGAINPQADVTGNLLQAIRMVQKARRERASLYDAIQQVDMLTGEVPDALTVGMLRLLYSGHYLTRALGRDRVAESLREYLGAALATRAEGDMFGEQVGPSAILAALNSKPTAEQNESTATTTEQPGAGTTQGERPAPGGDSSGRRADESGKQEQRPEPDRPGQTAPEDRGSGPGQDAQAQDGQQDREGAQGAGENGRGSVTAPAAERQAVTETPAFRRWFGDSKVVGDDGKPLVMYHGTSASENGDAFSSFDVYASNYGLMGMGGYFTADPAVASSYTTKGRGSTPTVYPVYLSIQHPLDMEAAADPALWKKQFEGIKDYHEGGESNESWYRAAEEVMSDRGLPSYEGAEAMQAGLRAMGFDGITHVGGGRVKADGVRHRVFIAFEPEQIKSATGNNGEFDPKKADIRFRQGNPTLYSSEGDAATRGLPLEQVEQAVQEALAGLRDAPPVHVVESLDEFGIPAGSAVVPKGGTLPDGRIIVYTGAAESGLDVQRTVFHELLHRGSKVRFKDNPTYVQTMLRLATNDAMLRHEAAEWKLSPDGREKWTAFSERGEMTGDRLANYEALAVEEGLASMAEKLFLPNTDDQTKIGTLKRLITFMARVAKAWGMSRLSEHLKSMTRSEAEQFIHETVQGAGGEVNQRTTALMLRQQAQGLSPEEAQNFLKLMPQATPTDTFREGEVQRVQQLVDTLRKDWVNAPPIVVVYDLKDERVPEAVQRRESKRSGAGAAEGFYYKGKAYLVASQLPTERDAARVLAHEVLGHHGLRAVFGDQLKPLLSQIVQVRTREVAAKMVDYKLEPTHENRLIAAEEVLANMAEKTPELGFVRRAVAAIRTWLREHGFKGLKVSDAEIIRDFILPARGWVERGNAAANGGLELAFSRSNEGQAAIPDAIIGSTLGSASKHPDYAAAKAGDIDAAVRLAQDLVTPDVVAKVKEVIGDSRPRLVPVSAEESAGRNKIPLATSAVLAGKLGLDVETGIVQANRAHRTGMDGLDRVFAPVDFDGTVEPGEYVLVDDTLTQGGTFAALASHIREGGGTVVGVVALTGKQYSAKIQPSSEILSTLRQKHGDLENEFRAATGYGFDALTESEARYLAKYEPAQRLRDRIAEEGRRGRARADEGDPGRQDDDGLRFSRAGEVPEEAKGKLAKLQDRVKALTSREAVDTWLYNWQDKLIDLKRIQAQIKALNGTVSETNDAYRGEELYHKRVAKRTSNFLRDEVRPLLKRLNDAKVGMEEFERFLHARHAPEANRVMAERNPSADELDAKRAAADIEVKRLRLQLQSSQAKGMATAPIQKALGKALIEADRWASAEPFRGTEEERQSLSGMSNDEAAKIMKGYAPERRAVMDELAARIDRINAGTLKALEDYGLMDRTTLDAWRKTYEHYVPLHRDEANPESKAHPIGQGFSTKGDASKQRTGSNEKVTNILSHIVMQREAALTRGEKNNVVKRLYLLASQNPDPELWSLDMPKKKVVDPETGLVKTVVDQGAKLRDNVVALRIGGKDQFIVFNDRNENAARLALAIKNLDATELDRFTRLMGRLTRWFAAVNTQYNPVFAVMNLARDLQGTLLQLSTTPLAGKQGEVFKNIRSNMGAIYKDLRRERREEGAGQGEWAKLWEQMQLDGGTTGYRDLYANPADRAEALQKALDQYGQGKLAAAARGTLEWLSDFNEMFEATTRLAVYKAALDHGLSRDHAASIAKNITVNFNRKGRNTSVVGSYYAFLNAAIQGNVRMLETLRGPAGRRIMMGGVAIGMMSALAGSLIMGGGGADDEWKKIPEFAKERSIIIPLGRQDYVSIPLPLGFHVFPNIGRKIVEFALHDDPTKSRAGYLADMALIAANAYNPLGGADNLMQMFAPTPFDPVVALMENKDWTGKPIYKEQRSGLDPKPGHTLAKDSTVPPARWAAQIINAATGGNEWKPGAWSPNPDAIEYLFGQFTGGVGRELTKVGNMATSVTTGEELAPHQMVLIGRMYGNTRGVNGQSGSYYENLKRINSSYAEAKGRAEGGEDADAVLADVPLAKVHGAAGLVQKRVGDLTKMRRKIQAGDDPRKRELVKEINEEIQRSMYQLNAAVESVIEEERKR